MRRSAPEWHGTGPQFLQLRGQRIVWGQKLSVTGTCLMSGESLIILSPDASRVTAILDDYKRRWEIETLFKASKSQGFDFEATHLTMLDRIEGTIQLLQLGHWGAALEGQDERVKKTVGLFAES